MDIVGQAKLDVIDLFKNNYSHKLVFHTLDHTLSVVHHCEMIGKEEGVTDGDLDAVLVAAWFHDTGYLRQLENHEQASVDLVTRFFEQHTADNSFREIVVSCIRATTRIEKPQSLPEQIILDADVAHLGDPDFIRISRQLKKERSNCSNCKVSSGDYWEETLLFMQHQKFYTNYARKVYCPVKELNLRMVEDLVSKQKSKDLKTKNPDVLRSTTKGIESMFRLTASNQMRLSAIADKKANILISINSIFISVSAAAVTKYHLMGERLVPSIIVLFVSSLCSLIFAILSCRPKLNNTKYTESDILEKRVNLLFFGNFFQIPYPRYNKAMKEMMHDYDYLYSTLIKDQYYLGLSLSRKYRLLRIAYNLFMAGFIAATLVFGVSWLIH